MKLTWEHQINSTQFRTEQNPSIQTFSNAIYIQNVKQISCDCWLTMSSNGNESLLSTVRYHDLFARNNSVPTLTQKNYRTFKDRQNIFQDLLGTRQHLNIDSQHWLIPMTHAPETGAENQLHFSGTSFWYVCHANLWPDSSGTKNRRQLENPGEKSVSDVYSLETHYYQISSRSDLKRRSLWLFW